MYDNDGILNPGDRSIEAKKLSAPIETDPKTTKNWYQNTRLMV